MEIFKLPSGVKDFLPHTASKKVGIESGLLSVFSNWGYERIDTSTLVNYNIYSEGIGAVQPSKLFKISDTDGEIIVLRTDMTLPITRIVATKLDTTRPIRLCYRGDSYNLSSDRDRAREYSQAGVELFGVPTFEGDAEVIALAIDSLLAVGLKDFKIDIGQVEIIKGILSETSLTEAEISDVVADIDKKVLVSSSLYPHLTDKEAELINDITLLYGDENVLEEAEKLISSKSSLEALNNLKAVYSLLSDYGYSQYISFDLGLVNSYNYYSGIVFKGITKHLGTPVLGGGRYDKLADKFGKSLSATGFAIGVCDLMQAVIVQGGDVKEESSPILVGSANDFKSRVEARKFALEMISNGKKVNLVYDLDSVQLKKLGEEKGSEAYYFGGNDQ